MDLNLLLVDDEHDFLTVVAERLTARGLNVLTATDGKEALQIMKRMSIDVVLLDVIMPGFSGLDTLAEMKKSFPETEVIMLSGLADIKTAVNAMTGGAFDYLTKPAAIDYLVSRVEDAHKKRRLKCHLLELKRSYAKP